MSIVTNAWAATMADNHATRTSMGELAVLGGGQLAAEG